MIWFLLLQLKINIENKINIKVVSPNFELEYGLDKSDIENRLERL